MFKDKNSTNFSNLQALFFMACGNFTMACTTLRVLFVLNGSVSLIERTDQYGHFTEKNSKWVSASWDVQGLRVE